ncbi:MAG: hypothetical protein AAB971_02380 [Patescibacteria group bacterium]
MYFVEKQLVNERAGTAARVFLPDPEDPDPNLSLNSLATSVEVTGQRREMLTGALRMMVAFNNNHSGRLMLGHDGHVFALACQTGDDQSGIRFDTNSGATVEAEELFCDGLQELPTEAGGVLFIRNAPFDDPLAFMANRYVMVRASLDDGVPLYVSKPGGGAVIAHTFEEIQGFYPAQSAGIIGNLSRVDPG